MSMLELKAKIGVLAMDIDDIETQISGLANLKKVKKEEIRQLRALLREKARNGEMDKEE